MPDPVEVRTFVQEHTSDLRTYLADLVRARTENPPGDEFRAAKVLTDFCDRHGIPWEKFEKVPGRTNIVARIGRGRPRIIVPCHFDTVPAGDGWTGDPFEPRIDGDRMFGRGTNDNKGPLAAMMLVARYLKEHEGEFAGQLVLAGVADEEAGSTLGMKYLIEECGLSGEAAIVPDVGHSMRMIDVGEKGLYFLKVRAIGRQAHGSEPRQGASALWPIVDFLERIRQWRPPLPPASPVAALFTPPTLNVGAIHAGTVPNMVPGRCEALIDTRYLPGTDGPAILEYMRGVLAGVQAAAPDVRLELEVLSEQQPTLVQADHPMIGVIERRTEEVLGLRPDRKGLSGATVAKFLILGGIPAVGFSCGAEGVAHTANEWVGMGEVGRFAEIMTLVLADLFQGGQCS
jgi:acetylornithine deacetylase/succinyl-diaminopimelate desuccinylase-like protein